MLLSLVSAAGLAAAGQDSTESASLIRKLGDDDVQTRDKAEQRLIEIGPAALEAVRGILDSTELEVRERARRIEAAIRRRQKIAKVYTPPSPRTVSRKATVREVIQSVLGDSPEALDLTAIRTVWDLEVSIDVHGGTAFDVLDAVCRQAGNIAYKIEGGQVRFALEPWKATPGFSTEAFRVSVRRREKYSSSDSPQVAWAVTLSADALPSCKIFGAPVVTVLEAFDAHGKPAKKTEQTFILGRENENAVPGAFARWNPGLGVETKRVYTFVSEEDTAVVSRIKGVASFYFRLDPTEVRFDNPNQRQERDLWDDFKLILDKGQKVNNFVIVGRGMRAARQGEGERLTFVIEPKKDAERWLWSVAGELIEKDSALVVDKNGRETKATLDYYGGQQQGIMVINGQVRSRFSGTFALDLGALKIEDVREVRIKVPGIHRKDMPFEIRDVSLP